MQSQADSLAQSVVAHSAPALLVDVSSERTVAFATHVALEVVETPEVQLLPCATSYACGMLKWQEYWVPLIDIHALISGADLCCEDEFEPSQDPNQHESKLKLAMILQCTSLDVLDNGTSNQTPYGAVLLHGVPRTVYVTDADQCNLPDDSSVWSDIAISCFSHQGAAVPIIHPNDLFNGEWSAH